jgi:hypothetical protein
MFLLYGEIQGFPTSLSSTIMGLKTLCFKYLWMDIITYLAMSQEMYAYLITHLMVTK